MSFHPKLNLLIGSNAQGKTSVLEAIYCLSTTRSFRVASDEEMITFGEESASIEGVFESNAGSDVYRIEIKKGKGKFLFVNGKKQKRLSSILGKCPTVVFSPDDLFLVKGGPSLRRRFLNMALVQVDGVYLSDLQHYERALRQRNALLKAKGNATERELTAWEEPLAWYGSNILIRRQAFVESLGLHAGGALGDLTGGTERFELAYAPSIPVEGGRETVTARLMEVLRSARVEEKLRGVTLYGPHRDDVTFSVNDRPLKKFGSQGQQRTATLALKLAEFTILKEEQGGPPLVLFDDVMSELDENRQAFFLQRLRSGGQAVLTGTVEGDFAIALQEARLITVQNGVLEEKMPGAIDKDPSERIN